jgi:hypothetical protein
VSCSPFIPTPISPILKGVSARRHPVTTVSPASKRKAERFEDFAADIARRREAAGNPELPRNSGERRTPSKRALLKAIGKAGGTW